MFVTRNVMMKYRSPTNGDGGDGGGGSAADDAAKKAAEEEAAKKAAEEEVARKAAEEEVAKKKQTDGNTGPSDAEAKLLKEVMEKKTKLKEVEGQLSAASAIVKQLEELGGLDAIKALVTEKKDAETKKLEDKGEWDRLKAQMNDEHGKTIKGVQDQLAASQAETESLRGVIAELTVGNAFATSGFIKEDLTMPVSKVRVLYGSHFEFKDGQVVAYDKPAGASERTMLVDGKGDPMNFEAALKKIVDTDPDRDQLLKSKMKPGAGSKTTGKGDAPASKLEQPSGLDKISGALAKGVLNKS